MLQLVIPDLDLEIFDRLRAEAARHGRTIETEAKTILWSALWPDPAKVRADMDAIRNALAATGREFRDSVEDIREDRDR